MSQRCEECCLLCEIIQQFKVNFAMIHGFGEFHSCSCQELFQICTHCSNFVSVTQIKPPAQCVSCQRAAFTIDLLCGHQACSACAVDTKTCKSCEESSNLCDKCTSLSEVSKLSCLHKICQQCMKLYRSCPKCSEICSDCGSTNNCSTLKCGIKNARIVFKSLICAQAVLILAMGVM